jgi:hypothetical protein
MNRDDLAHLLRAVATGTGQTDILVIGSQAILGSFDAADLPAITTVSIEADLGSVDAAGDEVADAIDGAVGELSPFHQAFGYYGQGISVTTAVLPAGWRERLVEFAIEAARPGRGWCLEPHDLVIAKLVRGDPKDYDFADALVAIEAVRPRVLSNRLAATDITEFDRARISRWIESGLRA